MPFAFHGWIVGATQSGMALGSLVVWRMGARLPRQLPASAAITALCAGLATAALANPITLAAIRFGYGFAMGLVYTQAMAQAAAKRPSGAYGAVFLSQLVLSTLVAPLLSILAEAASERFALMVLCLVPLTVFTLALRLPPAASPSVASTPTRFEEGDRGTSASAWLFAVATFLFVTAAMMVWTFLGALTGSAHLGDKVLGEAVALGSIAGVFTAFAVLRERPVVPPVLNGLVSGLTLLAPIFATGPGASAAGLVIAVVLFNIGSTAIIIRSSGLASAASGNLIFRRFVSCTHCLGMVTGPLAGSAIRMALGKEALLFATSVPIVAGCIALFAAAFAGPSGSSTSPRSS